MVGLRHSARARLPMRQGFAQVWRVLALRTRPRTGRSPIGKSWHAQRAVPATTRRGFGLLESDLVGWPYLTRYYVSSGPPQRAENAAGARSPLRSAREAGGRRTRARPRRSATGARARK